MKATGFRVAAVLLSTVCTFAILESVAAILLHYARHSVSLPAELSDQLVPGKFPETISDPYLLYKLRPNVQRSHYSTNSRGLRGDGVSQQEGQLRVLLLGGSVAWSYMVRSDAETLGAELTRYLQNGIERRGLQGWDSVVVSNAAVPAYVSRQEAIAYARDWRHLEPNLVITLDGVNDINAAITLHPGEPLVDWEKQNPLGHKPGPLLRGFSEWALYRLQRSKIYRLRRAWWPRPLSEHLSASPFQVAESYGESLHYLSTLTALDGASLVPVLQPVCSLATNKALTAFEETLAAEHEKELPGRNAYFEQSYSALQEVLNRLPDRFDHVFPLDARAAFEGETDHCFADCYHLTPRGVQLLSRFIGEHVLGVLSSRDTGT